MEKFFFWAFLESSWKIFFRHEARQEVVLWPDKRSDSSLELRIEKQFHEIYYSFSTLDSISVERKTLFIYFSSTSLVRFRLLNLIAVVQIHLESLIKYEHFISTFSAAIRNPREHKNKFTQWLRNWLFRIRSVSLFHCLLFYFLFGRMLWQCHPVNLTELFGWVIFVVLESTSQSS